MKAFRSVCVCLLLAAGVVWAEDLWNKESGAWSKKDAEQILGGSPWGRRIPTKVDYVKQEDSSAQPNTVDKFDRGVQKEGDFARVWWWSARTPRRAFMRIYELSGGKAGKEQMEQFTESKAKAYLISISEGGPMVAVSGKLSPDELKKAAWLQSPRFEHKIECEAVEVVMAGGRPDRIVFQFPHEVDGKPVMTSEDKRILFRWRLPKSTKETIHDAQQFEVAFEPKKMVARGEADY